MISALTPQNKMDQIMRADGRAKGMGWFALFMTAMI
jgi:hypothetical protein